MTRLLRYSLLFAVLAIVVIGGLIFSLTWRPDARESLPVSCTATAPTLVPGQALKVMTWNVQYLAGKRYVFWNDLAQGNDVRGTSAQLKYRNVGLDVLVLFNVLRLRTPIEAGVRVVYNTTVQQWVVEPLAFDIRL